MTTTVVEQTTAPAPQKLTLEERQAILVREVTGMAKRGWTVVSQTATQASLVKGKPTSHGLHLVLSIVTVGLWIPVWIGVAIFAGQKSKLVTITEAGDIVAT